MIDFRGPSSLGSEGFVNGGLRHGKMRCSLLCLIPGHLLQEALSHISFHF